MAKDSFTVNKKKLLIGIGIAFIVFIIFSIGSLIYTKRPGFCSSCHLMKPYFNAWKKSPHKEVSCLKCHIDPGIKAQIKGKIDGLVQVVDYVTGRYSEKPAATVNNAACLRGGCHEKEKVRNKKIMFKDKVEFTHARHWEHFPDLGKDIELRCASCHTWLTYDKHMEVDENTCLICHFKNVPVAKITQQCLNCHTEVSQLDEHPQYIKDGVHCQECHLTIKTTNAPVLKQMCYFCHADKKKLEKAGDRELMHQAHIPENSADCMNCHELIKHGKE